MTAGRRRADRGSAANVLSASRRRSQDARQVPHCRGLAPGMAVLSSQAGLRAAGAPWWTICLLSTLGLAAACLQIVFPQDSPDKVAWWSERRRTQRRHQWRQGYQRRRRCQCQHDSRFRVLRNRFRLFTRHRTRNGAGKPVTELGHSLLARGGRTVARLIGEWCNLGGFRGRCRRQASDDGDFPQRYAPRRLDEAGTDGARLYRPRLRVPRHD
jgi:hypothetical protein